MKAEITYKELWNNPSIMGFFLRQQSINTLEKLRNEFGCTPEGEENLSIAIDCYYESLNDFEEDLYNNSLEEMADVLGLEYEPEEDEEL